MSRDYYQDLEISKDTENIQSSIAQALSLKWHPKIQGSEDQQTRYSFFCKVSEAYEVLSDPVKRSFYDKYGEEKLKEGFFSQASKLLSFNASHFSTREDTDLEEILKKFLKNSLVNLSYFCDEKDSENKENIGSLFGYTFGAANLTAPLPPQTLEVEVECTLSELFNGCNKTVTYQRTVLTQDGRTTKNIKESKVIEIKPGFKNGEQIKYSKLGNEVAGLVSSDLNFTVKELPHPTLKRKGNDLIYYHRVQLINALSGRPVNFITLDSRKLFISIDQVINPNFVKKVIGEGMPIYDPQEYNKVEFFGRSANRGDLYIKFDITFPSEIDNEKRSELEAILGKN